MGLAGRVAAQLKRKPVSLTTHAARTQFMHKREGRRRYESLVAETKAAIDAADPIGLLKMGAPSSEYEPEIGTIVPRVAKAVLIRRSFERLNERGTGMHVAMADERLLGRRYGLERLQSWDVGSLAEDQR